MRILPSDPFCLNPCIGRTLHSDKVSRKFAVLDQTLKNGTHECEGMLCHHQSNNESLNTMCVLRISLVVPVCRYLFLLGMLMGQFSYIGAMRTCNTTHHLVLGSSSNADTLAAVI